jgi:hypothetical protein
VETKQKPACSNGAQKEIGTDAPMAALINLHSGCGIFWPLARTLGKRHEYLIECICALYILYVRCQSINQSINQSIPLLSLRRHKCLILLNQELLDLPENNTNSN